MSGDAQHAGRLRNGEIAWERPASGTAPEEGCYSFEHFRPYIGPVALDGNKLVIGGYVFARALDTEPE